jgi:hypothetical protein
MQNAKCKVQNGRTLLIFNLEFFFQIFCILHFAFCINKRFAFKNLF